MHLSFHTKPGRHGQWFYKWAVLVVSWRIIWNSYNRIDGKSPKRQLRALNNSYRKHPEATNNTFILLYLQAVYKTVRYARRCYWLWFNVDGVIFSFASAEAAGEDMHTVVINAAGRQNYKATDRPKENIARAKGQKVPPRSRKPPQTRQESKKSKKYGWCDFNIPAVMGYGSINRHKEPLLG